MKYCFYFILLCCALFSCTKNGGSPAHTHKEYSVLADSLRQQAREAREVSDFATSLQLADSAVNVSLLSHDTVIIVQCFNELGTNFRRIGRMEQAIRFHYDALQFAEQCTDTSFQARKNIVVACNGLGNAFLTLDERQEATRAFRRALAGEKALNSDLGQAINYANLGSLFEKEGELDSAEVYYKASMQHNQAIKSDLGIGLCHIYFGQLNEERGLVDAALEEYSTAAEIFTNIQDTWHALEPTIAIANLHLQQGDCKQAAPLIEQITETANQIHSIEHLAKAYELRSLLHEKQGKYELSLAEYKRALAYKDSVEDRNNSRQMREIFFQYDKKKQEQQLQKEREAATHTRKLYNTTIAFGLTTLLFIIIVLVLMLHAIRSRSSRLLKRLHNAYKQTDEISPLTTKDQAFLNQIDQYIEENMGGGNILVEDLSQYMGITADTMAKRLRLLTGTTPKNHIQKVRMEKAILLLKTSNKSIREIALECGYEDMSYFTRSVKRYAGRVPSALRNEPLPNERK